MMIMSFPFPLESSFIDVTLSIDPGKAFDPPLTPSSLVAPSLPSTPKDTTEDTLRLLSSPLPLAQCTRLEMGDSSRGDASFIEDDLLVWSGNNILLEPSFEEY